MKLFRYLAMSAVALFAVTAWAADFDGSKPLTCTPTKALDCLWGEQCDAVRPADIGAPASMRVDFAKKAVVGPVRSSKILAMDKSEDQIILQGKEGHFGWSIAINATSGEMTTTFVESDGAIVLFGTCTTK